MSTAMLAVVLLARVVIGQQQQAKALPAAAPAVPDLPIDWGAKPAQAGGSASVTSSSSMPGNPAQGVPGLLGGQSMPPFGTAQGNMGTSSGAFGELGAMLKKLGGKGDVLGSPVAMPPLPPMPCPSLIGMLQRFDNSTGSIELHTMCAKELGSICPTIFKDLGSRPWTADAVSKTCKRFGQNITRAYQDVMQEQATQAMTQMQAILKTVAAESKNPQMSSQRLFDMEPSISSTRQGLPTSAWAALGGTGCIVAAMAFVSLTRGTRPTVMAPFWDHDLEEHMHASEDNDLHE